MSASDATNSRRALSWLVILLGVALIGAALFVLLTLNGDEPDVVDQPPVDAPDDTEAPDDDGPAPPVSTTYEILLTRDPFAPVRPDEVADPDDPDADDVDEPDDVDAEDADEPPTQQESAPPPTQFPIVVLDVNGDEARLQLGDEVLDVEVGDSFGGRYELMAIVGGCARIRDVISGTVQQICPTNESFK